MEKIGKLRRALQAIVLAFIILIGAVIVNIDNIVIAVQPSGAPSKTDTAQDDGVYYDVDDKGITTGEIFEQYKQYTVSSEVPRNLFADDNITLWCVQHGRSVFKFMTATEQHYHAWNPSKPETWSRLTYDRNNPYRFYGRDDLGPGRVRTCGGASGKLCIMGCWP